MVTRARNRRGGFPPGLVHVEPGGCGKPIGMGHGPGPAIVPLDHGMDGTGDAVSEQRLTAVIFECHERIPQILRTIRQGTAPCVMPFLDGTRRLAVAEIRCLRIETGAAQVEFEAAVLGVMIETPESHRMQGRKKGCIRLFAQNMAQCDRAMRGEFSHQPVTQRPFPVVFLVCLIAGRNAVRIGFFINTAAAAGVLFVLIVTGFNVSYRLVLGTDKAALDAQLSVAVDTDKSSGPGDVFGLEAQGAPFDGLQQFLDLAETRIDIVGQFVRIGMRGFEFRLFSQ